MTFEQELAALPKETQAIIESAATVMMALRHSEHATQASRDAEANLTAARDRWQQLVADRTQYLRLPLDERFAMLGDVLAAAFQRAMQQEIEAALDSVIRHTVVTAQALEFLRRTTVTLEQAIKLHVMGR